MRSAQARARFDMWHPWLFKRSMRSVTTRQAKQTFGKQNEEDDHLPRVGMRVKELEPTVTALADAAGAAALARQKTVNKTAGERCATDRVQRQWGYCS